MRNEYRLSLKEFREQEGLEDEAQFIAQMSRFVHDGVAPALCVDACDVEPDGRCEHDCPSVLIAAGFI